MWEFTSADDPDLGHTFSRPSIVPLAGSGNSIRWGVVVGNGYNDLGSGEAKLFILFLEEGLDGIWSAGSDYIEISTGAGTTSNRNGLSTPAVIDTDGDGLADRAYAGDLQGNMWAHRAQQRDPNRSRQFTKYAGDIRYRPVSDNGRYYRYELTVDVRCLGCWRRGTHKT